MKIKESTIEIFNFVVFKSMNSTKITEIAALRPLRGLRLTSYSSFNFRHLWLHYTYCSNMRSSYSRYIWSSLQKVALSLLNKMYCLRFIRNPKQKSRPIRLVKGRAYYLEAVMKEHKGGDHLSVAVQQPGRSRPRPISKEDVYIRPPGKRLS